MVNVRIDMTGWKMWEHGVPDSRWIVIQQAEDYVNPKGQHFAQWLCECSCEKHTRKIVSQNNLTSLEGSRSCGCLKRERFYQAEKEYNDYDYSKTYGIGFCHNTKNEFYFDWEDFDKIKDYCWVEVTMGNEYKCLVAHNIHGDGYIRMTALLGCKYYDHKNRNPLDNRRENLRKATHSQNMMNRNKLSNNTSGVTGVSWHKKSNKWQARISINGFEKTIGMFVDKEEAIKARLIAESKYYGEFAPQKHLFEQYGIVYARDNKEGECVEV